MSQKWCSKIYFVTMQCLILLLALLVAIINVKAEESKKISDENGYYEITIPASVDLVPNNNHISGVLPVSVKTYEKSSFVINIKSENDFKEYAENSPLLVWENSRWTFLNAQSINLSGWNVENLESATSMFASTGFTEIDLSSWKTDKLQYTDSMFAGSSKLKTIYVSNLWNNSNVILSNGMFGGCILLVGQSGIKYGTVYDGTMANTQTGYFTDIANKIISSELQIAKQTIEMPETEETLEDEASNTQNVSLVSEENPVPQQEDVQQSVQENPEDEQ